MRLSWICVVVSLAVGVNCLQSKEDLRNPKTKHWSLQPLDRPEIPEPDSAAQVLSPIDAFIFSRLDSAGLNPSPPASRGVLIRRLSFDLIGLPPTPEEVEAFVQDPDPDAYEQLVDHLLSLPRFGERWARHWLDLVHFAETHGHDEDAIRENAWPYRDYVIQSFNTDKPFARFIKEQIAGDVLYPQDPQATVATAFLSSGPWDSSSQMGIQDGTIDKKIAQYLDRDDMIMTTMSTFVSLTVHCARCHDHKFDPVSSEDYYALQAVFAGVDRVDRPYDVVPEVYQRRILLTREIASLEISLSESKEKEKEKDGSCDLWLNDSDLNPHQRRDLIILKKKELEELPSPSKVFAVSSSFEPNGNFKPALKPRPIHLLLRGDIHRPGKLARAGVPDCIQGLESRFTIPDPDDEGLRRSALAEWISDPGNVLTWRSMVNRLWSHHFGVGIVKTQNDFGFMGSSPSHPDLLDWLACELRDNGGSLKQVHRQIVLSATYRQASKLNPESVGDDSTDRLFGRTKLRRLDAESLRDTIIYLSGSLKTEMGGASDRQFLLSKGVHITPVLDYVGFDPDHPDNYRRSIYRFIFRTVPDPFMQTMDCADASQLTPQRSESVTAHHALALLHNRFLIRQSELLAAQLERHYDELTDRIQRLFQLSYSRSPDSEELEAVGSYAREFGLANACRMIFNSSEFNYVD